MLTMTVAALEKQAQNFMDHLSHAQFKLDGVTNQVPIWKRERVGTTIRIYLLIGYEYAGHLTDVRIVDKDGLIVITSSETWTKPAERGIYITFKYRYLEREVQAVG